MKSEKKVLVIVFVFIIAAVAVAAVLMHGSGKDEGKTDETTISGEATENTDGAQQDKADESADDAEKQEAAASGAFEEYFEGKVKPEKISNDEGGNWRVVKVSTDKDNIEEYAADYYNKYFEKADSYEVHWIINLKNETTTSIVNFGGVLSVDTFKYVKGEEKDAQKIGSGELISSHYVWLDSGMIEEVGNEE